MFYVSAPWTCVQKSGGTLVSPLFGYIWRMAQKRPATRYNPTYLTLRSYGTPLKDYLEYRGLGLTCIGAGFGASPLIDPKEKASPGDFSAY